MEDFLPERVAVKLEGLLDGESRLLEIERDSDANSSFRLKIAEPDGSQREEALDLLCHSGQRWTFRQGPRIVDVVMARRGKFVEVRWNRRVFEIEVLSLRDKWLQQAAQAELEGIATVRAQMPGRVVRLLKEQGDRVESGEGVVVVEAMKMQNEIRSPKAGRIVRVQLQEGTHVQSGALLFEVE